MRRTVTIKKHHVCTFPFVLLKISRNSIQKTYYRFRGIQIQWPKMQLSIPRADHNKAWSGPSDYWLQYSLVTKPKLPIVLFWKIKDTLQEREWSKHIQMLTLQLKNTIQRGNCEKTFQCRHYTEKWTKTVASEWKHIQFGLCLVWFQIHFHFQFGF